MADPVKKPLRWSRAYPAYAEKHDMYRVFQELLKELIIRKPNDPLAFMRDELPMISRTLHCPRVFLIGPNVVSQGIGRNMAHRCGAKYLTLADVVESAPVSIRGVLGSLVTQTGEDFEENLRKLLVAAIKQRVSKPDCQKNGYVLYGFPQNQLQAKCAQQNGLLPRQIFVLLPTQNPEEQELNQIEVSSEHVNIPEIEYAEAKGVVEAYDYEICKVIPYEKWFSSKKQDIEAEILASIVAKKPSGSPFVPKVLIIGPPSSGKSVAAEVLCAKYSFVDVNFMDLVRGATKLDDDVAKACKKYLTDLKPMNDDYVKTLLQRRMLRDDCERKGWVLHGFPDTAKQLKLLELLNIAPNRVFLMYSPEDVCLNRLQMKKSEVLQRKLEVPGHEDKGLPHVDETRFDVNYGEFPYGNTVFRMRFEAFMENLPDISSYFGKEMIYVDTTQKKENIIQFIEDAVLRPPTIRFPDPNRPFN